MAQITKEITVDVAKKNSFQAIVAKQNDNNSRFLKVTLCNEGEKIEVPSTATVLINAERADSSSKAFAGTVNADGTVTVPLTNWMLKLDDAVRCSISVIDSDEQKLTSTSFSLDVEAAEYEGSDATDDDDYDNAANKINTIAEAVACNAVIEKEVATISTTDTSVQLPDTPIMSKAYIYLGCSGDLNSSQLITATPVYSGADYSAGAVSNMEPNNWYKLGVPASNSALSAVKLKVSTETISSVALIIRYDGNIDGNGVSY